MQNPFRNRQDDDYRRDWNDDREPSGYYSGQEDRSWREPDSRRDSALRNATSPRGGDWAPSYGRSAQSAQFHGGHDDHGVGQNQGQSDYGRGRSGFSTGGYDRSPDYGQNDRGRSHGYGGAYAERGRESGQAPGAQIWSDQDQRSIRQGSGGTYGQGQYARPEHEFEPDYLHWRENQMKTFDDDYRSWRDERRQKFSSDFDTWRNSRQDAPRNDLSASGVQDVADGGKGHPDDVKKKM